MKNRKQLGILKYGRRLATKAKMQGGGSFSAFSGGYNWREDPYEMMLLKDKLRKEDMALSGDGSGSGYGGKGSKTKLPKAPSLTDFPTLTGGLTGTRDYYNGLLQGQIEDYYAEVKSGTMDAIDLKERQGKIKTIANEFNSLLKEEGDLYDKNISKAKPLDLNTIAISADNRMFVYDKESKSRGVISSSEYYDNIDKYETQTKEEYAFWQRNVFSGIGENQDYITSFLGNGAVGNNSIYDLFIKGNEDKVKYAILNGALVSKQGKTKGGSISKSDAKQGLLDYIKYGTEIVKDNSTTRKAGIPDIIKDIYGSLIVGIEKNSVLRASLEAEVLKGGYNVQLLKDEKDVTKRKALMNRMVEAALVGKFIDKDSSENKENAPSVDPIKVNNNPILQDLFNKVYDASGSNEKFIMETDGNVIIGSTDTPNVSSLSLPMSRSTLNAHALNVSVEPDLEKPDQVKQNSVVGNSALAAVRKNDDLYTIEGYPLKGGVYTKGDYTNFVTEALRLTPGQGADTVYLPTDDNGKPIPGLAKNVNTIKRKAKQDYIKAYNSLQTVQGNKILTAADDLLPNSKIPGVANELKRLNEFISLGTEVKELEEEHNKDVYNTVNRDRFLKAEKSSKVLRETHATLKKEIIGSGNIRVKPFMIINVTIDNDYQADSTGDYFVESYQKKAGKNAINVTKANDDGVKSMDHLGKDDKNVKFWNKGYVSTSLLVPVSTSKVISSTLESLSELQIVTKGLTEILEKEFFLSSEDINLTADFLQIK